MKLNELLPLTEKENKILHYKNNSVTGYKFNNETLMFQEREFKNY